MWITFNLLSLIPVVENVLPALTDSHDHLLTCPHFFPIIYLPFLLLIYSPALTPSHVTCPHFFPRTFLPALTYFQRPFVEHRTPGSQATPWHRVRQTPPLDPGTCGPISPHSGRDCVKSLRSSCTGLYPQSCRANLQPHTPFAAGFWPRLEPFST